MKTVLSLVAIVVLFAVTSVSASGESKKPAEPVAAELVPAATDIAASTTAVAGSSVAVVPAEAGADAENKGVGGVVVDKVKACAAQKLKLEGCKKLKWPASTVCAKLADKKACLGL